MISHSIYDYVCLFLIFLLILYILRNKVNITIYILLFIFIGFFILRSYNIVKNNENFKASLDIYYPSKKDGVCNNEEEECSYSAIYGKLDKELNKHNIVEPFNTNASLDIYYSDDSYKEGNGLYPAVNKPIVTNNKYNNKEYENIYNGTWVDADKLIANTNIKKYNFLQKNGTLLLSIDTKEVKLEESIIAEEDKFLYDVEKYKFILNPDRLSFDNVDYKSNYSNGILELKASGNHVIKLYINEKTGKRVITLVKQSASNINIMGFTSSISKFYNNSANLNTPVQLEELESFGTIKETFEEESFEEESPNCCGRWQQTLNCIGRGPDDLDSDYLEISTGGKHGCDVPIPSGASGKCECVDGETYYYDCGHNPFKCEDVCSYNNCVSKTVVEPTASPVVEPKQYILTSSTFNNIFDTTNSCVFTGNGNNEEYYAIFLDPIDYSVLGIKNDSTDLELTMHNHTELSNYLRNNFTSTMKLSELNRLSKNTATINKDRKIYGVLRSFIESEVSSENLDSAITQSISDANLNTDEVTTIRNIFNTINTKYENYDLDNSEFLQHAISELNKEYNEDVNIFKVHNINKAQNSCDMTISFIPTRYDQSGKYQSAIRPYGYILNTEYYIVPNNEGTVDLTFQKLYSKNRIFRFEYVHNVEKSVQNNHSSLYSYLSKYRGISGIHCIFDSYIKCNDGRYLNNSSHCVSGNPYQWTVVLFKNTDKNILSKLLNYQ